MYNLRNILAVVTVLSFSQAAMAERAEILKCVDSSTMTMNEQCVAQTFDKHSLKNDDFFNKLTQQQFEKQHDAFAKITHFPDLNLIEVKSLESRAEKAEQELLIAANR